MAKYHFLTGDDLEAMDLTARVARCVEIKAAVVAADERESGSRALLNYGHTLGPCPGDRHGPRRSRTGRRSASGWSTRRRWPTCSDASTAARVEDHRRIVGGTYGLPTTRARRPAGRRADRADGARQEGARRADVRARRTARRGGGYRRRGGGRPQGAGPVAPVSERPGSSTAPRPSERANNQHLTVPAVRTERLLLRGWSDEDRPAWAAINADPVVRATLGPLQTRQQSDASIDQMSAHWDAARLRLVVRRSGRGMHRLHRPQHAVVRGAVHRCHGGRRPTVRRGRLAAGIGALGARLRAGGRSRRAGLRVRRARPRRDRVVHVRDEPQLPTGDGEARHDP